MPWSICAYRAACRGSYSCFKSRQHSRPLASSTPRTTASARPRTSWTSRLKSSELFWRPSALSASNRIA
eukprot:2792502-Heterocapsa_arctica.AAC.1